MAATSTSKERNERSVHQLKYTATFEEGNSAANLCACLSIYTELNGQTKVLAANRSLIKTE